MRRLPDPGLCYVCGRLATRCRVWLGFHRYQGAHRA